MPELRRPRDHLSPPAPPPLPASPPPLHARKDAPPAGMRGRSIGAERMCLVAGRGDVGVGARVRRGPVDSASWMVISLAGICAIFSPLVEASWFAASCARTVWGGSLWGRRRAAGEGVLLARGAGPLSRAARAHLQRVLPRAIRAAQTSEDPLAQRLLCQWRHLLARHAEELVRAVRVALLREPAGARAAKAVRLELRERVVARAKVCENALDVLVRVRCAGGRKFCVVDDVHSSFSNSSCGVSAAAAARASFCSSVLCTLFTTHLSSACPLPGIRGVVAAPRYFASPAGLSIAGGARGRV